MYSKNTSIDPSKSVSIDPRHRLQNLVRALASDQSEVNDDAEEIRQLLLQAAVPETPWPTLGEVPRQGPSEKAAPSLGAILLRVPTLLKGALRSIAARLSLDQDVSGPDPQPNLSGAGAGVTAPASSGASVENVQPHSGVIGESKSSKRDRVILEHLHLVKAIAARVRENLPFHVDLDDLVHAGIMGLFDAVNKFDPEKQIVFSSYAKHRIKCAILDSLRSYDWASRDPRRRHKQVEATIRDLAVELQRNPTDAEVAQKLGVDESRWRQMMVDLRNVGLISAATRGQDGDDLPPPDFTYAPELQPDLACARQQMRSALAEAMHALPDRYQKVVVLYYTNEMTVKEIGSVLGINESRVSRIHKAAIEKMAAVLESNGISSALAFSDLIES